MKVSEGDKAVFTVSRSGYTEVISSVTFKTRDGSATKGSDYEEYSGVLGFVSGEKTKTIEVRTFEDALSEGPEDFYLRINPDTPGKEIARSGFTRNVARCTIVERSITEGVPSTTDPDTELLLHLIQVLFQTQRKILNQYGKIFLQQKLKPQVLFQHMRLHQIGQ